MKGLRLTQLGALLVVGLIWSSAAQAVIFSPSQNDLLNIIDVTDDFDGGGSLFSASLDGDGVLYDFDFAQGNDGISRVVVENQTPSFTDLTGFDSFDIIFEPQSFALGVKTFIRTGDSGFFEHAINTQQVATNTPTRISMDLSSIPDLNDVRSFGIEMFDPDNGTSFATLARVSTAGPTVADGRGCALLIRVRVQP